MRAERDIALCAVADAGIKSSNERYDTKEDSICGRVAQGAAIAQEEVRRGEGSVYYCYAP